jgi:excisionase family DNA binding protein
MPTASFVDDFLGNWGGRFVSDPVPTMPDVAGGVRVSTSTPAAADPVLTLAEAAEIARVSTQTLYRAARAGEGPFYKVRAQWRVASSELRNWMQSREQSSVPADPGGVLGEVEALRREAE